jgi:tripartite-type tricarboxylate transporter receptor subunit TctC
VARHRRAQGHADRDHRQAQPREINAGLADAKIKARLADTGAAPFAGSPGDFARFMADETEKWAKVVKFAGIKAE